MKALDTHHLQFDEWLSDLTVASTGPESYERSFGRTNGAACRKRLSAS